MFHVNVTRYRITLLWKLQIISGVCVCCLIIYSGQQACGRTSRGHTGGRSHRISHTPFFCGARLNFCREKDSAVPFPRRPWRRILCTNELFVLHFLLGIFFSSVFFLRFFCVFVFVHTQYCSCRLVDVPAGVTQEEGHTGFLIHLPSAMLVLIFLARRIQPFLSLVDRDVEFCVLTDYSFSTCLAFFNAFFVYFLSIRSTRTVVVQPMIPPKRFNIFSP